MKLVIDGRKFFDSGIGTYIQNTLPDLVFNLIKSSNLQIFIIINNNQKDVVSKLFSCKINFIYSKHKKFSIFEQIFLHRIIGNNTYFWATSLNHPYFIRRKYLISTVYDLIPLAFKSRNYIERFIFFLLYKNIAKRSALIFFISNFTKSQFLNKFNFTGKSIVTYLGVDSDWFTKTNNKDDYIISYCNLKPHKNVGVIIDAFSKYNNKNNLKLILILNTEVRDLDINIIKRIRDNSSIIMIEHLDKNVLINYISNAKCLIVPSFYEGFGLTVLEGMACGCPVLASKCSAIPEVGEDTITYFNPYSSSDLLHKLTHIISNESIYSDLANKAKLRASKFTWSNCINVTFLELKLIFK